MEPNASFERLGSEFGAAVDRLSSVTVRVVCLALMVVIGVIDTVTGPELAFSIFYLMPLGVISWRCGRSAGTQSAIIAGLVWITADILSGATYSHWAVPIWNFTVRTLMFVLIAWLLAELRRSVDHERELARTDSLTGLANSRCMYETCGIEISRARRFKRPLTIVYIDCDNFKQINDRFGHAAGDHVLRMVANTLRACTRAIDTCARLGGDEFGLLLPETNARGAHVVINNVRERLNAQFEGVQPRITLSLGVATFNPPPATVDELLASADRLMYEVKRAGKDSVRYFSTDAGVETVLT
jgi:diguanylate cyclase (GGDEF)-like protein